MIKIGDLITVPWDPDHLRLVQKVELEWTTNLKNQNKWIIFCYHPQTKIISKFFMYEVVYEDRTIYTPSVTIVAA